MDCEDAGPVRAIDPKILDNWQAESALSIASWVQAGYEQLVEWDRRGSIQGDSEFLDQSFPTHPGRDDPFFDRSYETQKSTPSSQRASPEKYSFADYVVDGTLSGTISPRTISTLADDNFYPEDTWSQFQLYDPVPAGMPLESQLIFSQDKFLDTSANAVVLEDVVELPKKEDYSEFQPRQVAFQQIPRPFQFVTDNWSDMVSATTAEPAQETQPVSVETHVEDEVMNHSMEAPETRWAGELDMVNLASTSFADLPPQVSLNGASQSGQGTFHIKSESSSTAGHIGSGFDGSISGVSEGLQAITETSLSNNEAQSVKWDDASPEDDSCEEAQSFANPSVTAFVVSESPLESVFVPLPTGSRVASAAQRTASRHMPLNAQHGAALKKRKPRCSALAQDLCQARPLQIVQEDGQGGSFASADFVSPPRGARRKGPLSTVGRANAGLRRKNRDTCVQCRLNKRKCDGSSPCNACRPTLHEQPCVRACFSSIVEFGTCNYISQRAINHPTLDGKNRVRMEIPSAFDLNDLLDLLSERQGRFNIRTSQAWCSLYVLDLAETYKFLKDLSEYNGNSQSTFLEFIDRRLVESKDKSKNWIMCVKECEPMTNAYTLLSQWNNMPSRAKYSFVPVQPDYSERAMDIENADEQREILLAAQLSRIFCRMLEVEGFRKLERDFYNIKWRQISHDTHVRFLSELGHILLTLRWRVSWWKRLGDGGYDPDPNQRHYIDRVDLLCRILYVYYTWVLAKLPSWSAEDVPKGVWSRYPDSENAVWDDFPFDPTNDGFQKWLDRGQDLIEQAGVPGSVRKSRELS